ncbi:methyltransferase domain-containing protein [Bernardetia sp. ABR2-2B]|uniref:methyltransferase domain-containing protein n=1 Tax=Bernardetia sp. ABR2-2B TaxID=3127472 RepID=UPI0030D2B77C
MLSDSEFDRTKIYEQLQYLPKPQGYYKDIPWTVQQQVSATNGIQYEDIVGKLDTYPKYNLPVDAVSGDKLMLDIGCGWGRWLVAGAEKGYIPIGIDIRLEFCKTAKQTLAHFGKSGYTCVADLQHLPFIDGILDLVWSFSVIQHTHKQRLNSCLNNINRILNPKGYTYLEFPNKQGIRNSMGPAKTFHKEKDDINSWDVRYYTIEEYKNIFTPIFGNFDYDNHSFLGIGVLPEDLKYVSPKYKLICATSLFCSWFADRLSFMKKYSDSVFIKAKSQVEKAPQTSIEQLEKFWKAHQSNPNDNLNLVHLLRCPISHTSVELSEDKTQIISPSINKFYPIDETIPIMIASEAVSL